MSTMQDIKEPLPVAPDDVDPGVYAHVDPLLKRLRLQDPHGAPVNNLQRSFRDKEVLIFYVGSLHGDASQKDLHHSLIDLAIRQAKTCAVIYVSGDLVAAHQKSVIGDKPYWRMIMNDNSDFAAPQQDEELVLDQGELDIDEGFIQGNDILTGLKDVPFGEPMEEDEYVRPLSRSGLTALVKAFGTPSLFVYHVPSHKFISSNVSQSRFKPGRVEKFYASWKEGKSGDSVVAEIWRATSTSSIFALVAILYFVMMRTTGQDPLMLVLEIFGHKQGGGG